MQLGLHQRYISLCLFSYNEYKDNPGIYYDEYSSTSIGVCFRPYSSKPPTFGWYTPGEATTSARAATIAVMVAPMQAAIGGSKSG